MSKSVGRNDPCPCGSGKKFKRCCGESKAQAAGKTDWDEAVIEAGKLSLELDAVKVEAAVARLRELLAVSGLTDSQKLNGLETYATALQHHGEYQEALNQLEAIDAAWISAGDHFTRLAIAFRKATSLSHLKRTDEALAVARAAEQELPHVSPAMRAGTLLSLSQTYLLCGATDEAEKACNQSIALSDGKPDLHEVHARALANLASIRLGSGVEQSEAEGVALMERAIELKAQCGDLQGLASSYNNLAFYYGRIKRYERAIAFFRKDLQLSRIFGDLHGLAQTMLHLADLYSHLSQPNPAQKTLAEAEAVIERLGNESLKQSALVLSEAIAGRREYAVQQGEKIGPHAPCKCDSGKAYCDCCGQADFEPVSLPWDLDATSEATAQAYAELSALGIKPTRLDFFFRQAKEMHNRMAWYRLRPRDGWTEVLELPDVANIQLRTAKMSVAAATAHPESIEHPLAAIIMAVCAAEAFINQVAFFIKEVSTTDKLDFGSLPPPLPADPYEFQRTTELTLKWELLGKCLCGSSWPPTPKLTRDFKTLVQLRNEFVHFKLTDYEQIIPPSKEVPATVRSLPKEIELRQACHSWPFRVLTASTATWAVNVATELMNGFRQGYLAQRLRNDGECA